MRLTPGARIALRVLSMCDRAVISSRLSHGLTVNAAAVRVLLAHGLAEFADSHVTVRITQAGRDALKETP